MHGSHQSNQSLQNETKPTHARTGARVGRTVGVPVGARVGVPGWRVFMYIYMQSMVSDEAQCTCPSSARTQPDQITHPSVRQWGGLWACPSVTVWEQLCEGVRVYRIICQTNGDGSPDEKGTLK